MAKEITDRKAGLTPALQLTVADWAEVKKESSPSAKRNKQKDIIRAKVRNIAFAGKKAIKPRVHNDSGRSHGQQQMIAENEPEKVATQVRQGKESLKRKAGQEGTPKQQRTRPAQTTAIAREAARRSLSNSGVPREGLGVSDVEPVEHGIDDVQSEHSLDDEEENVQESKRANVKVAATDEKQTKKSKRRKRFYA